MITDSRIGWWTSSHDPELGSASSLYPIASCAQNSCEWVSTKSKTYSRLYEILLQLSWTVLELELLRCNHELQTWLPPLSDPLNWWRGPESSSSFTLSVQIPWLSKSWMPVYLGSCPIALVRRKAWKAAQNSVLTCQINSGPMQVLFCISQHELETQRSSLLGVSTWLTSSLLPRHLDGQCLSPGSWVLGSSVCSMLV